MSAFRSTPFHLILGSLAVSLALAGSLHAQTRADEYRTKAAFLRAFGRFVEWPVHSLPVRGSLIVGFIGDEPFGSILEDELRSKTANGHPILLRHLRWNQEMTGCHILFVSASEAKHLPAILRSISEDSVLTVSDLGQFAQQGGMIELVVVRNRIEFDINRRNATAAGLEIDSKLLGSARRIFTDELADGR